MSNKEEKKDEPKQAEDVKVSKKRGRKRKNKAYFTLTTQWAIVAYNGLGDDEIVRKNKIYNRFIKYPFEKLAENLYHTGKFYHINMHSLDVQYEVIAHLNEKIHKFQSDKGKAFSYFTRIALNFLIMENKKAYEKKLKSSEIDDIDTGRNIINEVSYSEYQHELKEFTQMFVEYYDENLANIYSKRRDISIADSVIALFRKCEDIEKYNKKALYLLIRERAGVSTKDTQHITKIVNNIKEDFMQKFLEYQKTGTIEKPNKNKFFY